MLTGCIAYIRLRKHGLGAVFAVVLYMLFVPFNIMALSYNTMGLICNFLCTVFLITSDGKYKNYIIAGCFFAGMVLCQPPLIFAFAVEFLVGLIYFLAHRQYGALRKSGAFLAGCVIAAIPVLAYFLIYVGLNNVIISLPGIMSDPSHKAITSFSALIQKILKFYLPKGILPIGNIIFSVRKILIIFFSGFLLIWLLLIVDKHRKKRQALYLSMSCVCSLFISVVYLACVQESYINFLLFAWALHGITFFAFSDKTERRMLLISYFVGLSHAMAFLGSNQYGYVFCIALLPVCLVVIMLSIKQIETRYRGCGVRIAVRQKALDAFICLCVIISMSFLVYARCVHVFWQTPPNTLNVWCDSGPQKGVIVAESTYEHFEKYLNDIREKDISQDDNILMLTQQTWLYLCLDTPLAQYSSWLSGINDKTFERLKVYYEINPEKRPDKIYVEKEEAEEKDVKLWADKNNYQLQVSKVSYFLERN